MALAGELQLAVRPDFGTEGSVALARTNCYKMSFDRQLEFVQYDGKQNLIFRMRCQCQSHVSDSVRNYISSW